MYFEEKVQRLGITNSMTWPECRFFPQQTRTDKRRLHYDGKIFSFNFFISKFAFQFFLRWHFSFWDLVLVLPKPGFTILDVNLEYFVTYKTSKLFYNLSKLNSEKWVKIGIICLTHVLLRLKACISNMFFFWNCLVSVGPLDIS